MTRYVIVPIVEGHGEVRAVPILYQTGNCLCLLWLFHLAQGLMALLWKSRPNCSQ
jgi:hypothetical protein